MNAKALPKFSQLLEGVDFYKEDQKVVFTSVYHLKRGYCCHSKCRHCPYGLGIAQKVRIDIQGLSCTIAPPSEPEAIAETSKTGVETNDESND